MERKLQRLTYIRTIHTKSGIIYTYKKGEYYLIYNEPDEQRKEAHDWQGLISILGFEDDYTGNVDRKGRVWCEIDYTNKNYNRCQTKLYKDDFTSVESYYEISIIEDKNVRMKDLINELSAEEYIHFIKDREINFVVGMK